MNLEPADAGERTLRGADFGREIGKRRDIVTDERRRIGELHTGELHAVARVAAKPNRGVFECPNLFIQYCGGSHRWKRILDLSCRTEVYWGKGRAPAEAFAHLGRQYERGANDRSWVL